jgi:hypothetical protein
MDYPTYMTDEMRDMLDKIAELEIEFRILETQAQTTPDGKRVDSPKDLSGYLIMREFELDELAEAAE